MFILNSRLESDSLFICDLKVSRLSLMNDSNYPWLILVPKRPDVTEIIDLSFDDQIEVLRETNMLSKILKENFSVEKLNIAALGNIVTQLHIHIIGRFQNDISFPKPVWGAVPSKPYSEDAAADIIQKIKSLL